jgi:transposase-like protein
MKIGSNKEICTNKLEQKYSAIYDQKMKEYQEKTPRERKIDEVIFAIKNDCLWMLREDTWTK